MTTIQRPQSEELGRSIDGKVVLVTGAASGIGFATAQLFATYGAKVVLADLNETMVKSAAERIGHNATAKRCDVSSWSDQLRLFDWTLSTFGQLDVVCCNAGIDPEIIHANAISEEQRKIAGSSVFHNFLADERTEYGVLKEPVDLVYNVNVKGCVYGIKLAIQHMRKRGCRIILTGSAASYMPVPEQANYSSSKHAALGLMRAVSQREECRHAGIAVSMVAPWLTLTPLTENIDSRHTAHVPASSAEDVAWAIGYLATAADDRVAGKSLWVRGSCFIEVEDSYQRWLAEMIKI